MEPGYSDPKWSRATSLDLAGLPPRTSAVLGLLFEEVVQSCEGLRSGASFGPGTVGSAGGSEIITPITLVFFGYEFGLGLAALVVGGGVVKLAIQTNMEVCVATVAGVSHADAQGAASGGV